MFKTHCKHGFHFSIMCFECEKSLKMRPIKKQASENEKLEAAKRRIYEAAKRLDW